MREIVEKAISKGAEFCDIRTVETESTLLEFKDGKLQTVNSGLDRGGGLRTISKGAWGFSSFTDTSRESLEKALNASLATSIQLADKVSPKVVLAKVDPSSKEFKWTPEKDPIPVPIETKLEMIRDMHDSAKEVEGVHSVTTAYGDIRDTVRIVNSEGTDLRSEVTRTFGRVQVTARKGSDVVSFADACGATGGMEIFDLRDPIAMSKSAGESAVRILSARRPPSGTMPLVADPDLAGVFAHEAVGHASEGDWVVAGNSCLEGIMGEKIGNDMVTIIDDPGLDGGYGSFPFDSEGVIGKKKFLVDHGVLSEYILNRETAHLLKMEPNGGARAASYNVLPIVRMSNTYIQEGDYSFEEVLEGIGKGVYAKGTRGGQVSTARGTFQFNASEAFLIENGEITVPLKDVSFSGQTLEVLKSIDRVGNDFQLGRPGNCGKYQWVPVSDGGPHVRVKEVTIGGGS
ncbi:MAG: TldD/PmbA family protein [Methanobacteriota archaeon]|nr:MAG: TldD/PmbA family protein [Euryarchaeota archaeon]